VPREPVLRQLRGLDQQRVPELQHVQCWVLPAHCLLVRQRHCVQAVHDMRQRWDHAGEGVQCHPQHRVRSVQDLCDRVLHLVKVFQHE
jgi:hypothetical protein